MSETRKRFKLLRDIDVLRRQMANTTQARIPDLVQKLAGAERDLHDARKAALPKPAPPDTSPPPVLRGAPIADTRPKRGLLGASEGTVSVKVHQRMEKIPTAIVHLLEPGKHPVVEYAITPGAQNTSLQVTTSVLGYSAECITTVEVPAVGGTKTVEHLPAFFPERLAGITELTRAALLVDVRKLSGEVLMRRTFPIWLMPRTTAPLAVRDPATETWVSMMDYLAAWVTPNAPLVTEVLRLAADYHQDKQLVGYQCDAAGVRAQVNAIYDALKKRELTYVNSVVAHGGDAATSFQRIRLPRESLQNRSANCIDGTVLLASLIEAASLNAGIVIVPGHAFLAWQAVEDDDTSWCYLETTVVGSQPFEAAVDAATLNVNSLGAGGIKLLEIPALREKGIWPIE